jgi:hypothetical protein
MKSFVVREKNGEFINSYNIAIGESVALTSAKQCAKRSQADIFEKTGEKEVKVYEWEDGTFKTIK